MPKPSVLPRARFFTAAPYRIMENARFIIAKKMPR
jgi:hypothetical protein